MSYRRKEGRREGDAGEEARGDKETLQMKWEGRRNEKRETQEREA